LPLECSFLANHTVLMLTGKKDASEGCQPNQHALTYGYIIILKKNN